MDKRVIFVHYARHVIGIGSFPVIVFQSGAYAVLGSGDVDLYREVGMDSAHSFYDICLLYTSPSPRDVEESRMPSSA